MRYRTEITAGSLKIPESRVIADLLLRGVEGEGWKQALYVDNVLQARSPQTAKKLGTLLRGRLETMDSGLWRLVRDGSAQAATHACLAAAVKRSPLLGDFLDLVIRQQYRLFTVALSNGLWEEYVSSCRDRDLATPEWSLSTIMRLRSSVFQTLEQAGYVDSTRTLKLQTVYIAREVLTYLHDSDEQYVLRCVEVCP